MKRIAAVVSVAVAVVSVAVLAWGLDDAPPAIQDTLERAEVRTTLGYANPACSLCHYAWDAPLVVNGTIERGALAASAMTASALDVVDARAVALARGDERTSIVALSEETSVVRGGEAELTVHVSEGATVLFASARPADAYAHPDLRLSIEGPDGSVADGAPGVLTHARIADARGIAEGYYTIRVHYDAGTHPSLDLIVDYDIGGAGVVPLADVAGGATEDWMVPNATERGVLVTFRPWNAHPTDRWILPSWGDTGLYSVLLAPGPAPNATAWADADVDAGWAGAERITLVDEAVDGTQLRVRNERGEWTTRSSWRAPPGPEQPFAKVPPGTTRLEARIEWSAATPLSPMPEFYFSYTLPGDPAFYYPGPVEVGDSFLRYEVPVEPRHWEGFAGTGAFQGFALARVDENGVMAFDGERRLVVEAIRD